MWLIKDTLTSLYKASKTRIKIMVFSQVQKLPNDNEGFKQKIDLIRLEFWLQCGEQRSEARMNDYEGISQELWPQIM